MKTSRVRRVAFDPSDALLRVSMGVFRELTAAHSLPFEVSEWDPGKATSFPAELDVVRLPLVKSPRWVDACAVVPLIVSRLGVADVFFSKAGDWSPGLLLERSLHQTIVREAHHMDIRASAYVLGEGPLLRVVAQVALNLGYRHLFLVGDDPRDLDGQAALLRRVFINADIQTLGIHSLTLQKVGASLLINTFDLSGRPDLAADLAYFNFMNRGGVVLDLQGFDSEQPVLVEAARAGLRVIPAIRIVAARDSQLLESLEVPLSEALEKDLHAAWGRAAASLGPSGK